MSSRNRFAQYAGREVQVKFIDSWNRYESGVLALDGMYYILINGWKIAVENVLSVTPLNTRPSLEDAPAASTDLQADKSTAKNQKEGGNGG